VRESRDRFEQKHEILHYARSFQRIRQETNLSNNSVNNFNVDSIIHDSIFELAEL
jgi:hypothetical protein